MPTREEVAQWEIQDWSSIKSTLTPLAGEIVYFNNVITGQLNIVSVIGDGLSLVEDLYLREVLEISSSVNFSLSTIAVSGNRVKVYNSNTSTIEITIGTGLIFYLQGNKAVDFYYNGSVWIHDKENVIMMTDADLVIGDMSGPTRVICQDGVVSTARTITLPTLADNCVRVHIN